MNAIAPVATKRGDANARIGIAAFAAAFAMSLLLSFRASAQEASPYAIDIPPWFVNTFLDFREDITDAAKVGKRLMAYFGQDGCPYCKRLMVVNFSQRNIVDKTRRQFVPIALNIYGDRETTWLDGTVATEKELAKKLKVQFTPTLLFFDESGHVVVRLNGYYPPAQFERVLDYVAGHHDKQQTLSQYLAQAEATDERREQKKADPAAEPFFMRPPYDLRRARGGKPLAVLFETVDCSDCDELHRDGLQRKEVRDLLEQFDIVRLPLGAPTELKTPQGNVTTAQGWARELKITYTPTIVLFDAEGREAFRMEAYLRPFHLASALEYVASGAYRAEPLFQRYVQTRAERLRAQGAPVDLWQ